MKTPKPFQIEDGDHIAKRRSALVAHQPRVGKTAIAIRACDLRGARIVVVVCPANVRENWRIAIRDDFRRGTWTAFIVSWNMAKQFLARMRLVDGFYIDVLILDESHYGKNRDASRTQAAYGPNCDGKFGLVGYANATYCLTGTPLPNDPTELWPMLHAIAPELILRANGKPMSWSMFRDRYCKLIRTGFGFKTVGSKNYRELKAKLDGFLIRRTRKEVFGTDLQPISKMYVKPSAAFAAELAALEASDEGQRIKLALEHGNGLAELKKDKTLGSKVRRLLSFAKVPGLIEQISEELDAEPELKIVLICWHTDVINAYASGLKKYGTLIYDGSTSSDKKVRLNKEFQEGKRYRVAVGQNIAIGVGLDWSAADICINAEPSYVGTDNAQAFARVFNIATLDRPKFPRFAVLVGGMDEAIINECERKLRDAERIHGE